MSNNGSNDATIRELVRSVTSDTQRLMKAQTELLRTEVKESQRGAGATAGMFIGALAVGGIGAIFLLVTLAYVLVALGLPTWAGFGIVTLVLLIVAVVLGALGRRAAKNIEGIPLAKAEWDRTKQLLSGQEPEVLPVPRTAGAAAQRTGDVSNRLT